MKLLVCCEESQTVCKAFRERGWEAYSCDILEESGGHPEWHIQQDVLPLINGDCKFTTCDGKEHEIIGEWDLLICHPPCTYLTCSGNRWFKPEYKDRFPDRFQQREDAVQFFMTFVNAKCKHIAVENPVGIMSTRYQKPDQYIQPYYFGDPEKKTTGLWIKGLPCLVPTNMVEPQIIRTKSGVNVPKWHMNTLPLPKEERSRLRSKTFPGIAQAMADQWGSYLESL